ncbi:MAG: hypothetical protein CME06_12770 [Gemmatimonadetes bacterium]|nr:hypothetical protein [Gemmatimonadota bacterium]
MTDFEKGLKREVAELKFLIHDLRVERFINEVIHFHVTLNTDLELYSIDQVQAIHGEDLQELKQKAADVRRAHQEYCNAVTSFSPDRTILLAGKKHIEGTYEICELILNPLWGRFDKVMSFLPDESRSVQSQRHYRNCLHWVCGVYYRIEHFLEEQIRKYVSERFDIAHDIADFTRNVIYGYVSEKGGARIELQIDRLDPAVVEGNRHRFRRMYFNLVMNAVDAMGGKRVGVITISEVIEGDRVVLRVSDDGTGISPSKNEQLLTDKESLDGELHSLGFVFVRQTIAQFGGELSIESEGGKGTTITVRLPYLPGAEAPPRQRSKCEKFAVEKRMLPALEPVDDPRGKKEGAGEPRSDADGRPPDEPRYGDLILSDYRRSDADPRGCIFAIAITGENEIELFTHRPYERFWNIAHEDLSPMFFDATVRGRLEPDPDGNPMLILKSAQNIREYFELKEVAEGDRSQETFRTMLREEFVKIARCLIDTGMPPETGVLMSDLRKLFDDRPELLDEEPFRLELLAGLGLDG